MSERVMVMHAVCRGREEKEDRSEGGWQDQA